MAHVRYLSSSCSKFEWAENSVVQACTKKLSSKQICCTTKWFLWKLYNLSHLYHQDLWGISAYLSHFFKLFTTHYFTNSNSVSIIFFKKRWWWTGLQFRPFFISRFFTNSQFGDSGIREINDLSITSFDSFTRLSGPSNHAHLSQCRPRPPHAVTKHENAVTSRKISWPARLDWKKNVIHSKS